MNNSKIDEFTGFTAKNQNRSKSVVVALSLTATIATTILFLFAFSFESKAPIAALGIGIGFIFTMLLVYAIASYSNVALASWIFAFALLAAFTVATALMGGVYAPCMIGIMIAPICATLVLSIRESLVILSASVALIAFFAIAPVMGIHFPENHLSAAQFATRSAVWQIACICMTFVALWRYNAYNEQVSVELTEQAATDKMTGFYSKDVTETLLYQQVQVSKRNEQSLSVIIIDIDYFKQINDTLGHKTGDLYIKRVAEVMFQEVQRSTDSIGRIGGDEFMILLPQANKEGAEQLANRIRLRAASIPLPQEIQGQRSLSLSIGVISYQGHPAYNHDDVFKSADAQLYRAKAEGRNKVCAGQIEGLTANIVAA